MISLNSISFFNLWINIASHTWSHTRPVHTHTWSMRVHRESCYLLFAPTAEVQQGGASNQDNCIDWGAEWAQQAFNTRGVKLCLNSSWDGWRMPFHFGISVWTIVSNSSVMIITHGHSHPEDLLPTIPSWGLPGWSLHGFLPTVQRHAQYIWWVPGFHSDVLVCIHWSWNQSQNNGVKQEWVFGI